MEYPSIGRMFGIELEFFLVDGNGEVANKADEIIQAMRKKLLDSEVKKECGHGMVELTSFPHISSREVFGKFFNDYENLLYEADKNGLGLYSFGTYPGKNANRMREDTRYKAQEKILGRENFAHAGRCVGLHLHYSLPTRTYNPLIKFFYPDINPRMKDKVLSLHNLYVGTDPAITTLMQSSPYYEGEYLAKDSRVLVYRGDPKLGYKDSMYAKHPEFGRLNNYFSTYDDLVRTIRSRFERWRDLLDEKDIEFSDFTKSDVSLLDSSWKPVKLTTHGTIESRGADMNSPLKVMAFSVMMKSLSNHVQNQNIKVQPSGTGMESPFLLEDGVLHIPDREELSVLQKRSAINGLSDKKAYQYSSSLIRLARRIVSDELRHTLRPLEQMIEDKTTISDELLKFVKKRQGYTQTIEQETARELALKYSEKMFKEVIIAKKTIDKVNIHSPLLEEVGHRLSRYC